MKIGLSDKFILIILTLVITAIGGGYKCSQSVHTQMTVIWKQTLQEDCANRMREINAKKKYTSSQRPSSDIKIETKDQTVHLKKDSTNSLTAEEKSFLADQFYLSLKNPIKIEKLDSLFRLKLKENGYDFKTAVSLYNTHSKKKTFYSINDISLLPNYLKLTYKVDLLDVVVLKGYVSGNWFVNLVWSKSYYILLSIIAFVAVVVLAMKKKKKYPKHLSTLKQSCVDNEIFTDANMTSSAEPIWQEAEQIAPHIIYVDANKHVLIYSGKTILLTPKVFALFYQLSQGAEYFQSYESLFQTIWTEKDNTEKKNLEQLVIRLRKELKDIPSLRIESIRGSGYQIISEETFTFSPM